jgi:hypothetical protein
LVDIDTAIAPVRQERVHIKLTATDKIPLADLNYFAEWSDT